MNLNMGASLKQKLSIRQYLSPKLLQQFQLLQSSYHQFNDSVESAVQDNIMLAFTSPNHTASPVPSSSSDFHDMIDYASYLSEPVTLRSYLVKQLKLTGVSKRDHQVLM